MEDLLEYTVATDRLDLWRRLLKANRVTRMAELGVWKGEFAASMLEGCPDLAHYYLVDPWRPLDRWNKPLNGPVGKFEEAYRTATQAVAFAGSRVTILRGTTLDVAHHIQDGSLDAVYIDGDHTLRGITIDLIRILPKLRPDGLLGGDDFFADPWHHGRRYEPTLVAPFAVHFAEALGLPVVALPFQQFFIRNRPCGFSFTNASGVEHPLCVGHPGISLRRLLQTASHGIRELLGLQHS